MPTINKRGIDTIMSLKKKIAAAFIACAMTLAVVPSAFACTALYVGSDLTEDGTTMFGRIEDLGTNDYNKLFNISPAGKHTAGEVYEGCYGFTYTFTHDSYRYTARRDDAAKFLGAYYENKIYESDPFQHLDQIGVGKLVKMAAHDGRETRPDLGLGICGEHGGDPTSVEFCHNVGLDYVSCSPFRVPIARLAAAQAAIKNPRK